MVAPDCLVYMGGNSITGNVCQSTICHVQYSHSTQDSPRYCRDIPTKSLLPTSYRADGSSMEAFIDSSRGECLSQERTRFRTSVATQSCQHTYSGLATNYIMSLRVPPSPSLPLATLLTHIQAVVDVNNRLIRPTTQSCHDISNHQAQCPRYLSRLPERQS